MNQTIKPILSFDRYSDREINEVGIYIKDNKLYYNGTLLLNAVKSKLMDIINFEKYPLNIMTLNKILKAYGFNDLINSLVINDYPNTNITFDLEPITFDLIPMTFDKKLAKAEKRLFSIGMGYSLKKSIITYDLVPITFDKTPMTFTDDQIPDNSYILAVGDQIKFLLGNGDRFSELESIFKNKLSELSDIYSRLNTLYNRISEVQDNTDLPIQILPEGHISDYVSFENSVIQTGTNIIQDGFSNITFDGIPITLDGVNIRWVDEIEVPIFDRIVEEDDIIDIVIGYKLLNDEPEGPSNITFDGVPITLDGINIRWVPEDENFFSFLRFDGDPITFDQYEMTYGDYPLYYLSSTLQVKESSMKIGEKFLIEINKDRLVVYSISPYITEYFIKSCRLIKRNLVTNLNTL